MDTKRIALIVFSVLLIVVLGVYAWRHRGGSSKLPYVVTDVNAFSLPREFPKGMPIPAGSKLVRNFTASDAMGNLVQSVQVYEAPLSALQVVGLFQSFFFANKKVWMVERQLTDARADTPQSIFARGPRGRLVIDVSPLVSDSMKATLEIRFIPLETSS